MGKIQHRNDLIEKIKNIEDKNVLDEIYRLLNINLKESVYQLNETQKLEIKQAWEQIERGEGIPAERLDKEIDEWLNDCCS